MMLVGWFLSGVAIIVLVIAALGIVRLPDALARQHAATKAATLAVSMFAVGLALVAVASGWGWGWLGRLVLLVAIIMLTLPLASHALARAGGAERQRDRHNGSTDVPPIPTAAVQPDLSRSVKKNDDV